MRRRWLILILAVLPFGALAALGARFDVPAWLSDRLEDVRAAVAPDPRISRSSDRPETRSTAAQSKPANTPRAPGGDAKLDQPATVAALETALASPVVVARPTTPPGPSIDIVRLDASQGMTVVAGTGLPNTKVTVLADGEPIAVVTADQNGEWVLITTHTFASADPTFTVRPGAMPIPRRALAEARAEAEAATPAGPGAGDNLLRPTAAAVTQGMIRQLERLTDDAAAAPADRRDAAGRALSTAALAPAAPAANPSALAVPIHFRYRETAFTDAGRKAADLLLRYFKAKDFSKVTLSGHADERGSENSNLDLSTGRLEHLAAFLRDGGFEGELELVPKGESEAYTGVDRNAYPVEELWQLDRRVEVLSVE